MSVSLCLSVSLSLCLSVSLSLCLSVSVSLCLYVSFNTHTHTHAHTHHVKLSLQTFSSDLYSICNSKFTITQNGSPSPAFPNSPYVNTTIQCTSNSHKLTYLYNSFTCTDGFVSLCHLSSVVCHLSSVVSLSVVSLSAVSLSLISLSLVSLSRLLSRHCLHRHPPLYIMFSPSFFMVSPISLCIVCVCVRIRYRRLLSWFRVHRLQVHWTPRFL
jgi:hypothetical protein